jgi:hypothetical protein
MCQTLAQGGKRCDTHKDGSKATVSLTSFIADVHEKIVRKVFTSLKKEGKGLENPEKEEVLSYAETGKFLTKHDPNIPERQKKTIMNQFEKAKEEEPSGPLFHAWKHTLPETLRRTRKSLMAVGMAGAIMATSACGGGGGQAIDPSPSVVPSSPSISQTATPSPSAVPTSVGIAPGSLVNGIPTKKEVVNDGKGEYIPTTISPDDSALQYNPAIVDPSASSSYTPEEILEAQKTAVTFIAEENIDSTLNNNPGDKDAQEAWWAKNKDKFDPASQDKLYVSLKSNDPNQPIVFRGQFRTNADGTDKYTLVSGSDKTHVYTRTITPTAIKAGVVDGRSLLGVQAKVEFALNADVNGNTVKEATSGDVSYTMIKNSEGKWLITGFYSTYNTAPAK